MALAPFETERAGRTPALYDVRWEEAWLKRARGMTIVQVADSMGVTRNTVIDWCRKYLESRRNTRNAEEELDYLIARFTSMADESLDAFRTSLDIPDVDWKTDPRPAHMSNAIKALMEVAKLSGHSINRNINVNQHVGESEVTIRVGGQEMVRKSIRRDREAMNGQALEVTSREVDGPGDGSGGEAPAQDGEAPGGD